LIENRKEHVNRREFLANSGWVAGGLMAGNFNAAAKSGSGQAGVAPMLTSVTPNPAQQSWMELGFGMFVHHGINTYFDMEWSDGTLDPFAYDPSALDTDQWCSVARDAGMKYIVMVSKHHDGFCLWPSKLTSYSVLASKRKTDVIGAVAESARKYGLKLGLYYSLWDRHEASHDSDIHRYVNAFMLPQLEELLTQYGDVTELWFDGFWKYQKTGWSPKNASIDGEAARQEEDLQRDLQFVQSWRNEGAYWWQMDHVYQQVKSWQPQCLVMNNSTTAYPGVPLFPVDIRSGEKYTHATQDRKVWQWLGKDVFLPLQIETTMSIKGDERFKSGNWFWHEWDQSVATRETILNYLEVARAMEANLLLNVGPSDRGLLREVDVSTLRSLRA
jgi:alpha-L-fucosidase